MDMDDIAPIPLHRCRKSDSSSLCPAEERNRRHIASLGSTWQGKLALCMSDKVKYGGRDRKTGAKNVES